MLGSFHGLYDGVIYIYIDARISESAPLAIVLAHELGHAVGSPRVASASVMRSGNVTIAPTPEAAAAIRVSRTVARARGARRARAARVP